jgi:hypothetical protein
MTHQQFMASPQNRARYWARSFRGWHEFAGVQPNAAHEGLARLQVRQPVTGDPRHALHGVGVGDDRWAAPALTQGCRWLGECYTVACAYMSHP